MSVPRFEIVDHPDGSKSVMFDCPGCEFAHSFRVEGPDDGRPLWTWNGDLVRATFSPSLLCRYPWGEQQEQRVCHSFVRDGRIQFLNDCTHALAGQTVDVPPIDD